MLFVTLKTARQELKQECFYNYSQTVIVRLARHNSPTPPFIMTRLLIGMHIACPSVCNGKA